MKIKTPLILIGIIFVLSGIAYWDDWKTSTEKQKKETENLLFSNLRQEDVDSVQITNQNGSILLKKDEGRWIIKEPVATRADDEEISMLLKTLMGYKFERNLGTKQKKDFGLDEPKVKIQLSTKDGKNFVLHLGENSPVGYSVYLLGSDFPEEVLIGSQHLVPSLNKSFSDMRDKSLGIPALDKLISWKLVNSSGEKISFRRVAESWKIENSNVKIDMNTFEHYFRQISGSVIESFVDHPSKEFIRALSTSQKGTKKIAEVEWSSREGEAVNFKVLENNSSFYVKFKGKPAFLKLKKEIESEFDKTLWDFQDKSVVKVDTNKVTKVVLDGHTFELDGNKNWIDSATKELKDHIRMMLVDIEFSKALNITKDPPFELGDPKHQLSIYSGDSLVEVSFWSNPKDPAVAYIKKSHENLYYEVESSILENFSEKDQVKGS